MALAPWRFVASLGTAFLVSSPSLAATSGDNGSHDPGRLIESEGRLYIYSTGGGAKSSADGLVFRNERAPEWNRSLLANNQGIWAPDILFVNGQYLLYGSMWNDSKASAMVLLTSPTLNPSSPNYRWTDRGVVVAGPAGVSHSVIDPAPLLDQEGNLWVVWGGGYPFPNEANSIFLTRLDPNTGLALTTDPSWRPPNSPGYALKQGHKEGPYIHFHAGYYYLFWQTGSCCSGASSTYLMHVARSQSVTGPYTGDRNFYASTSTMHGPGHMGIFSACGVERFTYHYYPNSGGSVIGENELRWGADGWPTVGPESTTPIRPCGSTGGGGMGGMGGAAGAAGAGGNGGNGGRATAGAGGSAGASASGAGGGGVGGAIGGGGMVGLGGTSGAAGVAGSGDPTNGGSPSTGTAGGGGTSTSGGAPSAGGPGVGGANASGSGGTATSGSGGAEAPEDPESEPPSGCACEVRGRKTGSEALGVALVALGAVAGVRRRRRPAR